MSATSRLRHLVLAAIGLLSAPLHAEQRFLFIEENDTLPISQDRHYTQGLMLDSLSEPFARGGLADRLVDGLGHVVPVFAATDSAIRRLEFIPIAQSLFTPKNLKLDPPDPADRPYAGWLYGGFGLLQENDQQSLHHLELLVGVVGPSALAKQAQDNFHNVLGLSNPAGYNHQLGDRGALQLSYDYHRRIRLAGQGPSGLDLVVEAGFSEGNVFRYEEAGFTFRSGTALDASYGPQRIRPAPSGTPWIDLGNVTASYRLNTFAGVQVRHLEYNAFIDRSREVSPVALRRTPWVADANLGAELFVGRYFQVSFSSTLRSKEFSGQKAYDVFGSVQLATTF